MINNHYYIMMYELYQIYIDEIILFGYNLGNLNMLILFIHLKLVLIAIM